MAKLLQINTVVNTGSTGRIAEDIGRRVINAGWESYIAYGRKMYSSNSNLVKIGNRFEQGLHLLNTRIMDKHGLSSKRSTIEFLRIVDDIQPDIIHLHNIHGYFLNYKILFEYLSSNNVPIVWTLHDCWSYTGHCAHYSFLGCERWKRQCYKCSGIKDYPKSLLRDRSRKNFEEKKDAFCSVDNMTIVPVSNWLAKEVSKSFLNKYRITPIHNGVNTDLFKPSTEILMRLKDSYGLNGKFVILGVANGWSERKGLEEFKRLSRLIADNDVIILVGLKKSQIANLPSNVIGIEKTENVSQLAEFYSIADIYVSFSMEETFGLTIAESLSCATPVLVNNSTAMPELLSKCTGFVIEPGDLKSVINKIDIVKKFGKTHFSSQCRKHAINCFNMNDKYNEYLNLYNSLL
jgi:glycosyltransferase involved in cell wall biosynthesis